MEYVIRNFEKFIDKVCEEKVEYKIENIHNRSDKGYKYLLSIKRNFIDLLKSFINAEWKEQIKEENLELVDKEFITSNFNKKESDLIYKVTLPKEEIYFILLEFQSKNDEKMPFRLLNYMVEIWRNWDKNNKDKKFNLPVIIPIVLYSKKGKWKAKTNFSEVFNSTNELKKYIPNFEYILLDINNYTDEELLEMGNVICSAMYMAKSKKEEIGSRLRNLCKEMKKLDEVEIRFLINWVSRVLSTKVINEEEIIDEIYSEEEEEMDGMLEWGRDMTRSRLEGRKEGKIEGRKEGELEKLKKLLIKKLGSCEDRLLELIDKASESEIDELYEEIFEIKSWEEVELILK